MGIRRLGQILVDLGYITDEQLTQLLEEQAAHPGEKLGKLAEEMGLISDEQLAAALAEQMGMRVIVLGDQQIPRTALNEISDTMAQMYRVMPVQLEDNTLTIATSEPQNLAIADELRTFLGRDIRVLVTTEADLNKALERYYATEGDTVESLVRDMENDIDLKKAAEMLERDGPIDRKSVV